MDPYLQGLECARGHRYCQTLRMAPNDLSDCAGKLKPQYPAGATLEGKVRFWFEDRICREHLFNPIATIVRRIYEITVDGQRPASQPSYDWCPICAQTFEGSFQTPDGHRVGSICVSGHRFCVGGSMSSDDDQGVFLGAEPDSAEIKTYAEIYSTKQYARCVHSDLREFMKRYLNGLSRK
jgi:hypothetical protein